MTYRIVADRAGPSTAQPATRTGPTHRTASLTEEEASFVFVLLYMADSTPANSTSPAALDDRRRGAVDCHRIVLILTCLLANLAQRFAPRVSSSSPSYLDRHWQGKDRNSLAAFYKMVRSSAVIPCFTSYPSQSLKFSLYVAIIGSRRRPLSS
jgi:hypothetical protein